MIAQEVDATGTAIGQPIIDKYTCADKTGTPNLAAGDFGYPPGIYDVTVQIESHDGSSIYGKSLTQNVDVTLRDGSITTDLVDDGGYFVFDWELRRTADNTLLTCATAGNPAAVEIISTGASSVTDKFDCVKGTGLTDPILSGSYTISVAALNANNQALGPSSDSSGHAIADHNGLTDLGLITIQVD